MSTIHAFWFFCITCAGFCIAAQANRDGSWIEKGDVYILDEWPEDSSADDYSGYGDSDEEGSGDGRRRETECSKLYKDVKRTGLVGAYIPQCTSSGEFESMQCHASTGKCWCVHRLTGKKIDATERFGGTEHMCSVYEEGDKPGIGNPPPYVPIKPEDGGILKNGNKPDTLPEDSNEVDQPLPTVEIIPPSNRPNTTPRDNGPSTNRLSNTFIKDPFVLAGIIGGAVVGLLCAVLIIMFIVYRMRKKDEGSYSLDVKGAPPYHYERAPYKDKEYHV